MHIFPFSTPLKCPNNDDLTAILKFKTTCIATNPSWICAKCHSCPQRSEALVRLWAWESSGDENLTLSSVSFANCFAFPQTWGCFLNGSTDGVSLLYWYCSSMHAPFLEYRYLANFMNKTSIQAKNNFMEVSLMGSYTYLIMY